MEFASGRLSHCIGSKHSCVTGREAESGLATAWLNGPDQPALRSVATVTWGQFRPLKFSSTVWEYCSWLGADSPWIVSSQNVAVTLTASAFGPRKAVFAVPPPGTGVASVATCSVIV